MSKQHVSIDIAGDLRTLPVPPEELWVRAPRPATSLLAQLVIAAAALIAVAVLALPLSQVLLTRIKPDHLTRHDIPKAPGSTA